ncbi:hypothetical protein SC1083_1518 [Aggregatibacter actinomycetemcomitans serotype e str. SC1083]|uniref:site-specific DNA-methyltransferase (adenine-specific) n=1 Tax=Aggregatibacter actinomycetemcomitans serotype e str. SC1083 TaxID=907488 RepID=G4A9K4_AGGAC|nr:hypothetical protein SC1083_1518 [Aggregatibacter actinomycetemcomitans serotype e str. SC1083]
MPGLGLPNPTALFSPPCEAKTEIKNKRTKKMTELYFTEQTKTLIDSLKTICAHYGLGNDGNEFKIISQAFLYKFLNDKYDFEVKKILEEKPGEPMEFVDMEIQSKTAVLKPEHSIRYLSQRQNDADFAKLFDDTLIDIAAHNAEVFAVKTEGGAKIVLFERISQYIADENRRDDFCRALISKLADFSFETIFAQKFDFFATIFEYLIKDYNSNSGGKYAEYYTPHAVARIMGDILVPQVLRGQMQRGRVRSVGGFGNIADERGARHRRRQMYDLYAGYFAKIVQPVAPESDFEQSGAFAEQCDSGQYDFVALPQGQNRSSEKIRFHRFQSAV